MGYRKDNQYRNYSKRDYDHKARKPDTKGASPSHVTITPKNNEPIEKTIKRFLRKIKKIGLADEYRKRRFYEKPSAKKRKQRLRREATLKKLRQKELK
jgi:small subunit ribosomal protein S21